MVSSVALLSLLGAAALAGVSSASVEKDDHTEEMVTRCIVEVLLNGLSKPNAPPIDPMCRELLKKSNQRKQEEKNVDKDLNTRQFSESEELEKPPGRTVKEEQDLNEEEFKRQVGGGQKWNPEERKHEDNGNQQSLSQGSPYLYDEAHTEENDDEKRSEEEDSYKRDNHGEEGSIEKKHSEEVEHELLDKKSFVTTGREAESDYKRSGSQRHSEESAHSQEKGNQASKEEEVGEEEEEESSEKYHHSLHQEYEDSVERVKAETEKQGHKPRQYHRKLRLGHSSEYKRHHNGEDSPEESSEEEINFWDKRSHYPKHHYVTGHHYEKRNSNEIHDSEEREGKSRSKEHQDRWHYTKEDDEEEDMRHHSREIEEKKPQHERKRPHDESQKEMRHHYEERKPHSKTSAEDVGRQHSNGRRDEKRHQHDGRQRLQLEETPKPQSIEREEEEQNLFSPEEGPREEKRYYPGAATEEEPDKRHHSEGGNHASNKRTLLVEEGYPRSHYLVENVKRAATAFIPYYQQLRWKNRHTEKKDDVGSPFLESDEEPRYHLDERDLFPEYNDYDSWEKKKLMDSLNPKHNERNLERMHKFDMKRQYNRMDELAHLLNYRKKSAEFPELYDSKEDVKRGHVIRSGEGKLSQRPLTQQEEKELENLAAMDLELQKIAEKFNNNQRG